MTGVAVLMVEDNPADVRLAREFLANDGFAIRHASTAAEARRWLSENRCDVILYDLGLPDAGQDPVATCLGIALMGRLARTVVFSGSESLTHIERLRGSGIMCVQKNDGLSVLRDALVAAASDRVIQAFRDPLPVKG